MTKKWRGSDFVKLRSMYRKGFKTQDIADKLGSTKSTVAAYISWEIQQGRVKGRKKSFNKYVSEDPLDKIFVNYHKSTVKDKDGQWEFREIDVKFMDWLNSWANLMKNGNYKNKTTEFGNGYRQAIHDVCHKLNMDWKLFDRRTKTGFAKE